MPTNAELGITDPTMKVFGDVTAQVKFNGIHITTTEAAPKQSILIHPETLNGLLDSIQGGALFEPYGTSSQQTIASKVAAPSVYTPIATPGIPITFSNTGRIGLMLFENGIEALDEKELDYVSRVADLPGDDTHRVTFDLVSKLRQLANENTNVEVESNETEDVSNDEPVCSDCLEELRSVHDTVVAFIDDNGIAGPGYIGVDYDKDVTVDVLSEATERFKDNEAANRSPSFQEALSRSLAIEVARSMVYEKFILGLAETVGFASDEEETYEDTDRGVYDAAA